MYNILLGWIIATHISKLVSTHLFDIMVGMMAWLVIFSLFFSISTGIVPNIGVEHIYILGAVLMFTIAFFLVIYLGRCRVCTGKNKKRKKK